MKITIGAIPDAQLNAKLEYIAPKGVENNGAVMFDMKAALSLSRDVYIRAGYSANAEIVLDRAEEVMVIPESCLEFSLDTAFVYVLLTEEPQSFEKKQVVTGLSDGIQIEIKSGLEVKDKIRGTAIVENKNR